MLIHLCESGCWLTFVWPSQGSCFSLCWIPFLFWSETKTTKIKPQFHWMPCCIISCKRPSRWYLCFQGRFSCWGPPTRPSGSFSPAKPVVPADTEHIPHTGVRGRLPSLPWILTAGTLSNSERRPLFPEASEQQWSACERVHQVSSVMNHRPLLPHSSLTHSLVISRLQTTHFVRKWAPWAWGNPEAFWNNCF